MATWSSMAGCGGCGRACCSEMGVAAGQMRLKEVCSVSAAMSCAGSRERGFAGFCFEV